MAHRDQPSPNACSCDVPRTSTQPTHKCFSPTRSFSLSCLCPSGMKKQGGAEERTSKRQRGSEQSQGQINAEDTGTRRTAIWQHPASGPLLDLRKVSSSRRLNPPRLFLLHHDFSFPESTQASILCTCEYLLDCNRGHAACLQEIGARSGYATAPTSRVS